MKNEVDNWHFFKYDYYRPKKQQNKLQKLINEPHFLIKFDAVIFKESKHHTF